MITVRHIELQRIKNIITVKHRWNIKAWTTRCQQCNRYVC